MNFGLSQDYIMLRKTVREFAENILAPGVVERDEKEYFDPSLFKIMGEHELTGIPFEEKWGGAGMDFLAYAIAIEEIGRIDPSTADTLSAHVSLGAGPIWKYGTAEQKSKYLIPLANGKKMGAFGLTESEAGSDALNMRTSATRDGSEWVLNGRKIFITNAEAAEVYIVFARTGDRSLRGKAFSAFIVEKDTPGFTFGKLEKKMGLRGTQNCDLVFEDCRIPAENMLGEEGEGFRIAMETLEGGRVGIAAQALGLAQGAFEAARDYAKQRVQFGRPIATLQAIQFKLADMLLEIEASRLLTYQAARKESAGEPFGLNAAMAKLKASETANKVAAEAVQIFGGYGYSRSYPVERMMRDAKITEIYEGTSEIMRVIIGGSIFK